MEIHFDVTKLKVGQKLMIWQGDQFKPPPPALRMSRLDFDLHTNRVNIKSSVMES